MISRFFVDLHLHDTQMYPSLTLLESTSKIDEHIENAKLFGENDAEPQESGKVDALEGIYGRKLRIMPN